MLSVLSKVTTLHVCRVCLYTLWKFPQTHSSPQQSSLTAQLWRAAACYHTNSVCVWVITENKWMERPGEQVHLGKGQTMCLSSCVREYGLSSRLILLAAVFFILSVGRCQDTTGRDNEEELFLWHWSVIRYSPHGVFALQSFPGSCTY